MTSPDRTYPYDEFYDQLDRSALVEMYKVAMGERADDVDVLTRTELIDALVGRTVEAEYHAEELGEDYPLRRPSPPQGLSILREIRRTDGHHVYWCWMKDWEAAVESLVGDLSEVAWDLPAGVRAGDVIVTAVDSEPALVTCIEQVSRVNGGTVFVEPRSTIDQPALVYDLERRVGANLPHATTVLEDETGDALMEQLVDMLEHPEPTFVVAGDCVPDGRREQGSAVHGLRILQDDEVTCAVCGAGGVGFELHYFRPRHFDLQLEIQDQLDDCAQLCTSCHRLCHSPSLKRLRAYVSPTSLKCPECREGDPRRYVWDVPFGADVLHTDEVVIGDRVLPGGPTPEYQCRACATDFNVVRTEELA